PPSRVVLNFGKQSFAQLLCSLSPSGVTLAPASTPFWAFDQEIFEKERTLTAVQGSAAGQARYFAIYGGPGWGFNPNNLVLRCAVRALELSRRRIRHCQKIDWDR